VTVKRLPPQEAYKLTEHGWTYIDVRSSQEFFEGHPAGAFNIPLMNFTAGRGMQANPDFLADVESAFAKDTPLVVGCKSGGRSLRAAEILSQNGYEQVVDMRGGFGGEHNPGSGAITCQGWEAEGLPTATEAEAGRSYNDIRNAADDTDDDEPDPSQGPGAQ
jgi:rhodanese-related sulfurtransferase